MIGSSVATVADLQRDGILLVEDGNHGEYRPRPNEFVHEGVAFIRAADMNDGLIDFAAASRINDRAAKRITKGIGRPGDVLLSHKGTVGKIARAPQNAPPFVCSPQTTFWRTLNENYLDGQYLHVLMRSPFFSAQLASRAGETDMAPYVSLTAQRSFKLLIPELTRQHAIANIISALDDKIELNRRMNETLEASARALFRDWFVDFGPTRAKAEGRPAYLAPDLWSLFPERLDEEGVPEGWEVKPLDQIAEFLNGLALQKYPPVIGEKDIPVIKIAELRSDISTNSNRASPALPTKYIVEDGDFLFSWSGSLLAKFWTGGRGALNQHLFKVTSQIYPAWFYAHWVWHHLMEFQMIAASKATTMGHIQRGHLSAATTICPPLPALAAFGEIMAPLQQRMIDNLIESRTLAATRDALLPKLMSGEIRVRETEALAA